MRVEPSEPERVEVVADGRTIVLIPYDVFVAADVFLNCGRSEAEVLPLAGVTPQEWHDLHKAYRWFHSHLGDLDKKRYLATLTETEAARIILRPRWKVEEREGEALTLRVTAAIRDATLRDPHVGPFRAVDWTARYIATHAEATLCHYLHDGRTVYFRGKPLETKAGEKLDVDAQSFEWLGGRWLRDARRVYGQGELGGARPRFYWYVVEGADAQSFEILNLRYARDRNQAYYITGKTLRTKSPDAFEIVPDVRLNYRDLSCDLLADISRFARDREKVYHYGAHLRGARPATFRNLGHDYASDGVDVWYTETRKRLAGVDVATFTVPGPGEPHVSKRGLSVVTDRFRPYVEHEPLDPAGEVEDWRPFFEFRTDLEGWWWHELAGRRDDGP